MKQTVVSLKVVAYVRNEGEARSRKVIVDLEGKPRINTSLQRILEHSLPELHPGQGLTKVIK